MTSLPTLRRKILKSFSTIILLYAVLGIFLVASVFLSNSTTPKMLHVNYDSIAASDQMREAWNALDRPDRFPNHPSSFWMNQFEKAISFEESNITEPGEKEIAQGIRTNWENYKNSKKDLVTISLNQFSNMNQLLTNLVRVNEKGMFGLTEENANLSQKVLIFAIIYFLITLVLALLIADGLANRLSRPLKSIAEALQRRPEIGKRLKLVEPNSLELLILSNELKRLWEQVVESQRINIREILEQKQKLETLLESVEDALLVLDLEGNIAHYNQYFLALINLSSEQVIKQCWTDLPTTNENYLKLRSALQEDMPTSIELELVKDHSIRHYSARVRKINSSSGTPIATLFLIHDITEKKQRDRFRAEFIDLLSHEIKTPLQSLGTASEFLITHKELLPPDIVPFAETISEDVERIRAVANEFVQVTQSHSKVMKLKFQLTSLTQTLPEWIKPFRIIARDRDVKLEYKQEGSEIILAKLDPVKFPWVISNLLSNAIRFSPMGGEVEVYLTDRNGSVEIRVKDQGPGVSEEDQRRMFEPFYQSPMTTSSGRQGLFGIGLTITKEVVEAHDGRIEYYRRQPTGSEFRILLPFPAETFG